VHADDPAGPWSEPVFVPEAIGIDPDLCWDDDGHCYLTWNAVDFAAREQAIRQARLDLTNGQLIGPPYPVWQGSGRHGRGGGGSAPRTRQGSAVASVACQPVFVHATMASANALTLCAVSVGMVGVRVYTSCSTTVESFRDRGR
jgi:glycosyl hydrolase family 43